MRVCIGFLICSIGFDRNLIPVKVYADVSYIKFGRVENFNRNIYREVADFKRYLIAVFVDGVHQMRF